MPRRLAPIPADKLVRIASDFDNARNTLVGIHAELKGHVRSTELGKLKRLIDKLEDILGPVTTTTINVISLPDTDEPTEDADVETE